MSLSCAHLRAALERAPWPTTHGDPKPRATHYTAPYRSMIAPAPWIMRGQNQLISFAAVVALIFFAAVYALA